MPGSPLASGNRRLKKTAQNRTMTTYEPMAFHLETERLSMQLWAESDAEELAALMSERGRGTPAVEHTREIIVKALAKTAADGLALLPIRRRDEGDFIGYCGLTVGRSTVEEPEIAYELLRHVHGRGYATEATRAVLDAAIATGRKRLWSTVRTWNAPSFRVRRSVRLTSRLYASSGDLGLQDG